MLKPSRTYRKWSSMIQRCTNPKHPAFAYYGGRGIKVCGEWHYSFKAFKDALGEAPGGLWLDRIDNAKGYEPGNCRWVTPKQSASNRRKRGPNVNRLSIRQQAIAAGIPYIRVIQRLHAGWKMREALSIPVLKPGAQTLDIRKKIRPD